VLVTRLGHAMGGGGDFRFTRGSPLTLLGTPLGLTRLVIVGVGKIGDASRKRLKKVKRKAKRPPVIVMRLGDVNGPAPKAATRVAAWTPPPTI